MIANSNRLREFVTDCWRDILAQLCNAAVYIDDNAAECLHWHTGDNAYSTLINAGAVSVHEIALYNFRYAKVEDARKAVVISTSAEKAFYHRTIKMIIDKNDFQHFTIICAAKCNSSYSSSTSLFNETVNYLQLKQDVTSWLNSKNPSQDNTVEIMFRPVFIAPINDYFFVTPPIGKFMPPLNKEITTDLEANADFLVNSLNSLCTKLNLKEDIYSIGKFSDYVADKLENLTAAIDRRNNAGVNATGVSVILVDRTVDLCTATSNNTESTLSKILCTLPHLAHHQNDVAVNMSPLYPLENSQLGIPHGCLATTDNDMMNLVISEKQKDVFLKANKILFEMSKLKESPRAKVATRISVHSLEKLVHKFRDTKDLEFLTTMGKELQIIMAVIEALKSEKITQLDLLISLEKLILQNLAISRDSSSILTQLSNIFKTRSSRGLDTENLLALLIHIHALAGTEIHFPSTQVEQLREAIADSVYEDIKNFEALDSTSNISVYQQAVLLLGAKDDKKARNVATKISTNIINALECVAKQRESLRSYSSLMIKPSPQEMVQCVGVLEQLIVSMLRPDRPALLDVNQRTSSLISSGFNFLLKGRTKCHPCDNPWIIIYVIGGITADEMRKVRQLVKSRKPNCRVTLGGSKLLTPLDVVENVLLPCFNTY